MKIVVQKFGGTSVANPALREEVVKRVQEARAEGYKPVVVVSAMGRSGDPYATDTLKDLMVSNCGCGEQSLRDMDLIMGCGEIISSVVMSSTLCANDIPSLALTGGQAGMVTDGNYGNAQVIEFNPERLQAHLRNDEVVVVTGFQGMSHEGELNTLGRGGSDTSAVILGAGLGADRVEIYTDVCGIMTADPKLVSDARIIDNITYNEVCQLAYEGAKVIHPRAVEVAMHHNVALVVKHLSESGDGTMIGSESNYMGEGRFGQRDSHVITGIAHTPGLAQVTVDMGADDADLELAMFDRLAESDISIDMISIFPERKNFTIEEEKQLQAEATLKKLGVDYKITSGCAKVSVVGLGMRNLPGVMARVIKALNEKSIRILQTGDSNITISLLIPESDLSEALCILHDHFRLSAPPGDDERVLA
ncbi:aspartate kinase [Dethiobacter alkaliphilus]|uniref:Aspartokinase n=1 Tax=Dethiobacter alkaliphilus AHT 1 TaxID=555088 RepID=C0GG12_DETAL|nr:aspartate kinase [Dethiobacter alkaliphilus]EEG77701.1 aspartate kinase [Dethiobacter alkaliphilus AHT 1]